MDPRGSGSSSSSNVFGTQSSKAFGTQSSKEFGTQSSNRAAAAAAAEAAETSAASGSGQATQHRAAAGWRRPACVACSIAIYSLLAAAWIGNPSSDSLQQFVAGHGAHWGSTAMPSSFEQRPAVLSPAQLLLSWLAGEHQPAEPAEPAVAAQHYSLGLFSLGEADSSWYFGSAIAGWQPLPLLLAPVAWAAASAAGAVAAVADAAAAGLGWLVWLLWQQGGPLGCLATALEWAAGTLARMPAGRP